MNAAGVHAALGVHQDSWSMAGRQWPGFGRALTVAGAMFSQAVDQEENDLAP